MNDDERAIRSLVSSFISLTQQGDVDGVLNLLSDDVVFSTCGREPFGKEQFEKQNREMVGMLKEGKAEILELSIHGDWAWIRCKLDLTFASGSDTKHASGYTLTILKKENGSRWVIFRDANLLGN